MKVIKKKTLKPITYSIAMLSATIAMFGCAPSINALNNLNTNTITSNIDIEDYMTEYEDPQESSYALLDRGYKDGRFFVNTNNLYLESSIYVSSNPCMYGYTPVDLDILNKYSIYYINPCNGWIEDYLNNKEYTCKNISIEKYVDESGNEYLLYKCDVYVVNDFDNGKTVELSGKVWPIQDIATIEPIAPVETFNLTYTALSSVDENGNIKLIADKQEGYDRTCLNGELDTYLLNREEKKNKSH